MASTTTLHNKVAIVTGSSRGIGAAIALELGKQGALVAVHYSADRDNATQIVDGITGEGGQAFAIRADLTTLAGVDILVNALKSTLHQHGRDSVVDILVNNAGIQTDDGLEKISEADFDKLFSVNVKAPFFLTRALLPMIAEGGRIINISSGLSKIAFPDKMAYAMGKAAISSFTMSLAKLVGERKITVNAIGPGLIETDLNPWLKNPTGRARVASIAALNRVGQPKDVADVVAFIASEASGWITGTYIDVSGGSLLG